MQPCNTSIIGYLHRGPCLRVTGVAFPGFPMLVLYLLSLAHRSVPPPPVGPRCWLQVAEARSPTYGRAKRQGSGGVGHLGIKPRQWSYLGSGWRLPVQNPGS